MPLHPPPRRAGLASLSAVLDSALGALAVDDGTTLPGAPATLSDAFLFSGNRHESVPRALFLDRRLTPLERNAWQVFRLQLNRDGLTAFPTYDQLRPFLAAMPCVPKASFETVARALTVLRLARWLSLARRRRDVSTGRILGNLYVLHDEPLTPFEAMQIDCEYLGLVSHALTHASRAIQRVGYHVLREISDDPLLAGPVLPNRLQVLTQRLAEHDLPGDEATDDDDAAPSTSSENAYPPSGVPPKSEASDAALLRNAVTPASDSEAGHKPAADTALRNPKPDRTVRSSQQVEVRTVPHARATALPSRLQWPDRFTGLKNEQQSGALVALLQIDASLQQAVLDEWDARCRTSLVRNPAGYLFGIIQKAIRGEFKVWAGQAGRASQQRPAPTSIPSPDPPRTPASREVAQEHIARLQAMLRIR